ncbi:MAG: FG-GAP repeat domain-containing protein, partial [Candidatus Asgardarchaeia archaeon]
MKGTKFLFILVMAMLIQGIVFSIYVNASTITYNSWNKKTFNYSMSVNAVFTADVDYDNDVDIFAVVGGNLILLENINNNDWVKHTIIESSIWGRDVVYVDIDNDGSGEVFFSNDNLGVIMIELNESNNISNYTRVLRSSPWTIWYGDVDGDNYTEVVTEYVYVIDYNQSTNTISYYSVIRSDIGAFLAHDVRCGNYDSDANDEIIVDSMSFYGNATTIYLLDYVNNTQWDISPIYNFSYAIYTLFSADLDNNGIDEIICGTEDGSIIILSKVNTTWTEIASFSIISDYVVYNIYATDVDADGIVDIVAKIGPRTTGNKSVIKFFDMASLYPLNFTMIDVGETDTWGNIHSLVCTNLDN